MKELSDIDIRFIQSILCSSALSRPEKDVLIQLADDLREECKREIITNLNDFEARSKSRKKRLYEKIAPMLGESADSLDSLISKVVEESKRNRPVLN